MVQYQSTVRVFLNFQNVLETDHADTKFTLKESQVSVKQIIEIQEQETVRMFIFIN